MRDFSIESSDEPYEASRSCAIPRRPLRVLIAGPTLSFKPTRGPFVGSRAGLMFYAFVHRLANGFVRNGHFVLTLNDRDSRKQMLGLRAAGAWLANRRLSHVARELQPDLLCLQHSDLITSDTVQRIKEMVPHCRVAVVFFDNIFDPREAARFRRFAQVADFAFVTTAGPTLAEFAADCPVAFIPNPVDLSIDNSSAFSVVEKSFDVFFASGAGGATDRWGLVDELCRLRPDLRYALHGRDRHVRLLGDAYYRAIEQCKIGLNLNRYERDLYACDRMAQYLGNGLLLATSRRSGYQRYFDDSEMLFFDDVAELGDKIVWAIADDRRWRTMAERARAKAAGFMGGQLVTDFILRMTFGQEPPKEWQFSDQIYRAPATRASTRPAVIDVGPELVPQPSWGQ